MEEVMEAIEAYEKKAGTKPTNRVVSERGDIIVEGSLMVYWIPQVPMDVFCVPWIPQVPVKAFYVPVYNTKEAKKILDTLAYYDIFQLENNIKPDYCNAGGLLVFENDEFIDWDNPETGETIDD